MSFFQVLLVLIAMRAMIFLFHAIRNQHRDLKTMYTIQFITMLFISGCLALAYNL